MTDTDDLRWILREDAHDAPVVLIADILAGVRRKVRTRRRVRWVAAAAGACALAVAAATVTPPLIDSTTPEPVYPMPTPNETEPHREFPQRLAGGQLMTAEFSEPGGSRLEWEVILDTDYRRVSVDLFCQLPKSPGRDLRSPVRLVVAVNGVKTLTSTCFEAPVSIMDASGSTSGVTGGAYDEIRPGAHLVVSARLQLGGEAVEVPGSVLGVAFYTGRRLETSYMN